jgi:2-octaprenyl-3-methyl-6-methoxy-1,4-benzoquinol hydroxylase
MTNFDCVVIGGGMIGAATALSLAEQGLTVAVVEKYQPHDFTEDQAIDLRVSAISLSSQYLLEQLGVWPQIKQWRACPYKRLGVWEKEFSYTEFNAKDIEQEHLGHIVENRLIQLALWQRISELSSITMLCPEQIVAIEQDENKVTITLLEKTITAKLVVGADGANSQVRQLVNIGITAWDYQQSAMLINVETELPQQDITWQQFYPSGPVAFLPLPDNSSDKKHEKGGNASLVWYHQRDDIKRLMALSNTQLREEILKAFPKRLGDIKVINKGAFDLTRRHANTYQSNRVLIIGDAAHTINPMAGQGVNLGFKDVVALQNVITSAISDGKNWHDIAVLSRYEKLRRKDNLLMQSTMDSLYLSFSHPSPLIKSIRNISLFALNKLPIINKQLKNKALAYACGL